MPNNAILLLFVIFTVFYVILQDRKSLSWNFDSIKFSGHNNCLIKTIYFSYILLFKRLASLLMAQGYKTTNYFYYVVGVILFNSALTGYNFNLDGITESLLKTTVESQNNGKFSFMKDWHVTTMDQWGNLMLVHTIGTLLSTLVFFYNATIFGRKTMVFISAFSSLIGTLIQGFSGSPFILGTGRVICGVGNGICYLIVPVYMLEVSPDPLKNAVISFYPFGHFFGALLSQIGGIICARLGSWRWFFHIPSILAILYLFLLVLCTESPEYYEGKGDSKRASDARKSLYSYPRKIEPMEEETKDEKKKEEGGIKKKRNILKVFFDKRNARALLVGSIIHICFQFAGLTAHFAFGQTILGHYDQQKAKYCGISTQITYALGIISYIFLGARYSLKKFLAGSLLEVGLCAALYGITLITQKEILSYILINCLSFSYGCGFVSIPWMISGELFEPEDSFLFASYFTFLNILSVFPVVKVIPTYCLGSLKSAGYGFFGCAFCAIVGSISVSALYKVRKPTKISNV
eukprot:GHVP01056216.1.p1 GENE.GHVP01056216.1~~GHVP01056216.1.p1  ORF type:complete len:520 (+),score=59.73 GHVP01056216.1:708-2267(+)